MGPFEDFLTLNLIFCSLDLISITFTSISSPFLYFLTSSSGLEEYERSLTCKNPSISNSSTLFYKIE